MVNIDKNARKNWNETQRRNERYREMEKVYFTEYETITNITNSEIESSKQTEVTEGIIENKESAKSKTHHFIEEQEKRTKLGKTLENLFCVRVTK